MRRVFRGGPAGRGGKDAFAGANQRSGGRPVFRTGIPPAGDRARTVASPIFADNEFPCASTSAGRGGIGEVAAKTSIPGSQAPPARGCSLTAQFIYSQFVANKG